MASNYTEHYQLPIWAPEDSFLREEFNDANQKIDDALGEKAAAETVSALQAQVAALAAAAGNCRIAAGTQDFTQGPAMTRAEAIDAIAAGIALVRAQKAQGVQLLATGEMGIGNSTPATAINCALFGFDPDVATGPGAGSDPERVRHKAAIVRRALEVNAAALKGDGVDILAALGGFELAIMAGIMLGAASRSLPILVDGFICSAAYAAAVRICPLVAQYAILSHASAEPGHVPALGALDSGTPLLHLDMRLGEGTGGAVAYHLLRCAVNIFNEMATFAEAQVDEGL